jgi:hypothetical protein
MDKILQDEQDAFGILFRHVNPVDPVKIIVWLRLLPRFVGKVAPRKILCDPLRPLRLTHWIEPQSSELAAASKNRFSYGRKR